MEVTNIYERYDLHTTSDKFFVEPLDADGGQLQGQQCLCIDRLSHELTLQDRDVIPFQAERRTIYGVIGIIHLVAGPYLCVVTGRELMGVVNEHRIWKMTDSDIIPYSRTTLHLTENQVRENRRFISLTQQVLKTDGFYFSYTFDITHSLQRLENTTPEFRQLPMHLRADHRFLWNKHLLSDIILQNELHRFALPLMHGFAEIKQCRIHGNPFQLILISRRSWFRAGTRFYMRGIDSDGNSANFVETEQILEYNNFLCAFVQTRGSIPLFWSQKPNLQWLPFPQLSSTSNHSQAVRNHMDNQTLTYPGIHVIVNLVNTKGRERAVGRVLEEAILDARMENVRYEPFDFHNECKNMNWERLSILNEKLKPQLDEFGYFASRTDGGHEVLLQMGYLRSNCMDCLDRTNVVQSMLAKCSLESQLRRLLLLRADDFLASHQDFENTFKNLWADNGDMLSLQYAGTGALKADFTRLGRRTFAGLMRDGYNAIVRYGKNNFFDGQRQDAIDLFLGNFLPDPTRSIPGEDWRDWRGLMVLGLIFSVSMLILSLIFSTEHTFYIGSFWLMVTSVLVAVIYLYGEEFVNKPKLKVE